MEISIKKIICGIIFSHCIVFTVHASETLTSLDLSIRRIGLEWSKTDVRNSAQYQDSPVSALKADGQDIFKAIFDTALTYNSEKFEWDNSLFMEYGETKLMPYNQPTSINENSDEILLSSGLSYAYWQWSGLKLGPTVRASYDTEFFANNTSPRQNIIRTSAGVSLFDNTIIKSLYLTGVREFDFTYSAEKHSKLAAEIGWRLEYKIRDGVALSTNGYYREYFSFSRFISTDLVRDFSAVIRLDTNLWGGLTLGPYIQYRLARSRGADVYGSNLIIGLSFNYIASFNIF